MPKHQIFALAFCWSSERDFVEGHLEETIYNSLQARDGPQSVINYSIFRWFVSGQFILEGETLSQPCSDSELN